MLGANSTAAASAFRPLKPAPTMTRSKSGIAKPNLPVEARVLADARLLSSSCLAAFLGPVPTDAHVHLIAAWLEGAFLCRSPDTFDTNKQSFLLGTPEGRKSYDHDSERR